MWACDLELVHAVVLALTQEGAVRLHETAEEQILLHQLVRPAQRDPQRRRLRDQRVTASRHTPPPRYGFVQKKNKKTKKKEIPHAPCTHPTGEVTGGEGLGEGEGKRRQTEAAQRPAARLISSRTWVAGGEGKSWTEREERRDGAR